MISQLLDSLPGTIFRPLKKENVTWVKLAVGSSNTTYRLCCRLGSSPIEFTLRAPNGEVNDNNYYIEEYYNHLTAEKYGLAQGLRYYDFETGISIYNYYPGEELTPSAIRAGNNLQKTVSALKACHQIPQPFMHQKNPLKYYKKSRISPTDTRLEKLRIPELSSLLEEADEVVSILGKQKMLCVPQHGDMVLENIILGAKGVQLIDWQRSGMGPAEDDLSTLVYSAQLGRDEIVQLIQLYYGKTPKADPNTLWLYIYLGQHHFVHKRLVAAFKDNQNIGPSHTLSKRIQRLNDLSLMPEFQEAKSQFSH